MDFTRFKPAIGIVNKEIEETLEGEPKNLYNAARHIITAGGKRIRPLLCIISCRAVGGEDKDAVKTAAAIELIHNFTLIHDDIMDNDDLRRGMKAVHIAYGESTAILAGDLLFSKVFELCDQSTVKILAEASAMVCEGQEMDMSFEKRSDVKEKEYMEMIRKKTAVLLEAATKSGGVLGKGSNEEINNLASFGLNVGLAFQIKDDLLGILSDEEKLGKPVGSDIIEGKKNLIVIKGLELLEGREKSRLLEIVSSKNNSNREIDEALELFKSSGALNYCSERMNYYTKAAGDSLSKLEDTEARKDLTALSDFIIKRDF